MQSYYEDDREFRNRLEKKCESFFEEHIPCLDSTDWFIAGGSIPRLAHDLPLRDIDLYINSDKSFREFRDAYIGHEGYQIMRDKSRFCTFLHKDSGLTIDLIGFHEPRNSNYVSKFDFSVCRFAWGRVNGKLENDKYQLRYFYDSDVFDLMSKTLRYTGSLSRYGAVEVTRFAGATRDDPVNIGPNNVLTRLKKYMNLGFTPPDSTLQELLYDLIAKDPTNTVHSPYVDPSALKNIRYAGNPPLPGAYSSTFSNIKPLPPSFDVSFPPSGVFPSEASSSPKGSKVFDKSFFDRFRDMIPKKDKDK